MKKDLILHLVYTASFFVLIIVLRSWFKPADFINFAIGGLLGTMIPYLDYIIYAYFLKSETQVQLDSINSKNIFTALKTYWHSKEIANDLIFHTAFFQAILLIFVFFVITSTGSLLARGIVLAFALHLAVDQFKDYLELKNTDSWFARFPMPLEVFQKRAFIFANGGLILLLGLLF